MNWMKKRLMDFLSSKYTWSVKRCGCKKMPYDSEEYYRKNFLETLINWQDIYDSDKN